MAQTHLYNVCHRNIIDIGGYVNVSYLQWVNDTSFSVTVVIHLDCEVSDPATMRCPLSGVLSQGKKSLMVTFHNQSHDLYIAEKQAEL